MNEEPRSLIKAIESQIPANTKEHFALRKSPQEMSGSSAAVTTTLRALKESLGLPATAEHPFIDLGLELFKEYRTAVIC